MFKSLSIHFYPFLHLLPSPLPEHPIHFTEISVVSKPKQVQPIWAAVCHIKVIRSDIWEFTCQFYHFPVGLYTLISLLLQDDQLCLNVKCLALSSPSQWQVPVLWVSASTRPQKLLPSMLDHRKFMKLVYRQYNQISRLKFG